MVRSSFIFLIIIKSGLVVLVVRYIFTFKFWILFTACKFCTPVLIGGFSLESSDCKSPPVFTTLQSRFSQYWGLHSLQFFPLISISSNLCSKTVGTVPKPPTTSGITVTLIFHRCSSSLARYKHLSIFLLSFIFSLWSSGNGKLQKMTNYFLLFN